MEPIHFTDYDKISDTLMYFSQDVILKFNVNLSKVGKNRKRTPFHTEYAYQSSKSGYKAYSIKRQFNCFFTIDNVKSFEDNVMIRPQDVVLLQMVLRNQVLPWIMGSSRIYGFDDNERLILKGKFTKVDFPLSEYKYIAFLPIVIDYSDNTSKEGIRIIINRSDNIVDININQFLEFYYYISNVDMYSAACSLMNYVKMGPYGENMTDTTALNYTPGSNGSGNSFFNNLH